MRRNLIRYGNPACLLIDKPLYEQILRALDEVSNGGKQIRLKLLASVILDEVIRNRNTKLLIALLDRLWPKPVAIHLEAEQPLIQETVEPDLSCLSDAELRFMVKIRKKLAIANAEAPQDYTRRE